jgi:tRNA threonylcarbamoyladenosine biosynthesis protein TsaE
MVAMILEVKNELEMKRLGEKLGLLLRGGEIIELVGDVGAGKTTLTKGIARGLHVDEDIQSPSFTISRVYEARDGLTLAHYDFYRLHDAGVMADELHETLHTPTAITIIEWADIVLGVLPTERLSIHISPTSEESRKVELKASGKKATKIVEKLT